MRNLALVSSLALALPLTAQTAEIQNVHASFATSSDLFGGAVAASGTRTLVGAQSESALGSTSGAAYLYDRQADGGWVESVRLLPSDGASADHFGRAVALSGDRALVGSYQGDGPAGMNQGAAYIFDRQGDGTWLETAKLTPTTATAFDEFGLAVALDGDFAAVGTYKNADVATLAGKVWVFERQPDGTWNEAAVLTASDATGGDEFGWSLALSGETLMVGAAQQAVPVGGSVGAVYMFERSGGGWPEVQKLVGSDSISLDYFGWSVALDGDLAVVGAYNAESSTDPFSWDEGAAYVFERSVGVWSQTARLEASDAESKDELGYSVGISGERIVAGAWDEDAGGSNAGAVYLFERSGGVWNETKLVASDAAAGDLFGYSVAMAGDIAVVGARNDDDFGSSSGSAYIFDTEPLSGPAAAISLAAGGGQAMDLDAGHLHAGELYFLLGSASGTAPGFPIGPGLTLPLNPDFYFTLTLNNPNQPPLTNSFAILNGAGHSTAAFTLPAGTNPALAGLTVHHAYGTIAPGLVATFASNALAVELVP